MRVTKYLLCLAIVAGLAQARAETLEQTVGSTALKLAVPAQFCALSENDSRDRLFIATISKLLQGTNKLVMTVADCALLAKWRRGDNKPVRNYAIYYVPDAAVNLTLPGDAVALRKSLCDEMRKQGQSTMDKAKEIITQKTKELSVNVRMNDVTYLGVIDEDLDGCYAAVLLRGLDTEGKPFAISGIITSTIVKAKPIFFAFYNSYENEGTVLDGVQKSKAVAQEVAMANR